MSRAEVVVVAAFAALAAGVAARFVAELVGRWLVAWRGRTEVDAEWARVNGGGR